MPDAPPTYLVKITYTAADKTRRQGSGVFISERHVLTCYHVLKRQGDSGPPKTVKLNETLNGKYLCGDAESDLAVIETNPQPDMPVPAWIADELRNGDPVFTAAFPAGQFDRARHGVHHWSGNRIQITGTVEPGASGGTLEYADYRGCLCIGLLRDREHENSGAIPASAVKTFLQSHDLELPCTPPQRPAARKYDPSRYLAWLDGETQKIHIRGLKVPKAMEGQREAPLLEAYSMDKLYAPLHTQGVKGGKPVRLEVAVTENRRLVIQGDAGSGKSTFLRYLAGQYCQKKSKFPVLIQIARLDQFIDVKRKHPDYPQDVETPGWLALYLEHVASVAGRDWGHLDRHFFAAKLKDKDTVVLLDGLDEAANTKRREHMARLFENAQTGSQCHWVVTTRPNAYEGKSTLLDFASVSILELEPEQIESFLREWTLCLHDNNQDAADEELRKLQKSLKESPPRIRRMARNPLMLSALAVVHYNDGKLPQQRAALYECILGWLASTRDEKRKEQNRVSPERMLELCGYLAYTMQHHKQRYETRLGRGAAQEILLTKDPSLDAEAFLAAEEEDSGILTSEGHSVKFYHRSYQEYLAARYVGKQRSTARWTLVERHLARGEWRETLVLLAGYLHGAAEDYLHEFFEQLVEYGLAQKLEMRARVVGLMGAMLADLESTRYKLSDAAVPGYAELREDVMAIFELGGLPKLEVKERAQIADALAQGHDSRLRLPGQDDYFVEEQGVKLGRFPVTVWEYQAYVDDGGEEPQEWATQNETPSRPVVRVSWTQARDYAAWVARTVSGVRLPTDDEWEHVASGGGKRVYPWGDAKPTVKHANFDMHVGRSTAVGLFPAGNTPEGIADLAGNVWEWTSEDSARGGGFVNGAGSLRAAVRSRNQPDLRVAYQGFRLVRE